MHRFRAVKAASAWCYGAIPLALGGGLMASQLQASKTSECKSKFVSAEQFLLSKLSQDLTPKDSIEFDTSVPMRKRMEAMIFRIQDQICAGIEAVDGHKFRTDEWEREGHGGGGRSRILQVNK
jgi:coproporphyrinogen III oxidase